MALFSKKNKRLKIMKKYKSIYEAKQVGNIYHFTNIRNLEDIIKDNYVLKSFMKSRRSKITPSKVLYISFTRDFQLAGDFKNKEVRITINGNKLSNKYNIQPYSDYSGSKWRTESEEAIFKDKINIKDSIIQIDILYDEDKFKDFYNQKYDLIKKQKEKFNFVDKWKIVK